jgi:urease accessory protein
MFANTCPSESEGIDLPSQSPDPLGRVRVRGGVDITLSQRDSITYLGRSRERDGYKVRVPNRHGALEVAIINTGGGIAGGDEIGVTVNAAARTEAVVTAPAAERVYRAAAKAVAKYNISISLEAGASLAWLPQETILFDGARFERTINVDMAEDARLVLAEAIIFGRTARGERYGTGNLRDRWNIRRGGKLVYAEATRLSGDIGNLSARMPTLQNMSAAATTLVVGHDCEAKMVGLDRLLGEIRSSDFLTAASSWNGILVIRMLARSGRALRNGLEALLPNICDTRLPRVWNC